MYQKKTEKHHKGYCSICKKVVPMEKIRTDIRPFFKYICLKCNQKKKE